LTPSAIAPDLAEGATLARTTLKAARGRILGAGGAVIVEPRPVIRVGVDKSQLETGDDAARIARGLAGRVGIDARPYVRLVQRSGPRAFVQAIVLRRSDPLARSFEVSPMAGVRVLADHLPLTPTRDFAPGLIGTVGPATAELIEESDGRLRAGDDTGLSGLQARYDEQLAGRSGVRIVSVLDGERTELFSAPSTDGEDLTLTLDPRRQARAVAALSGVSFDSSLVAIRPSTGEILVAASGPGSDGLNTATFGKAAPGSTFKIVSALGLLRSGLKPDSPIDCPPTTSVDGKSFKNYSDYPAGSLGRITLTEAVAQSCNTAFISQAEKLTPAVERDAAAALGFGVDHDLGFPAYFGEIPPPESDTEAAADLIGQGRVQASAMSMATVLASVIAGETVLPSLVPSVSVEQKAPSDPLTAGEARQLRTMLRAVVQRGSGSSLQGIASFAKTGTAEFGTEGKTHAWMVAGRDDLAVAVYVEDGESGSQTAGPILREFLG
jgi:cell division protein FtsI/penicillin-binding protein 2